MKNRNRYFLMLVLVILAVATSGCNVINTLRAKDSLNEGVREFNKGKYQIAEDKFNLALRLKPELENAEFFRALAIYQQFKELKSSETPEKIEGEFTRTVKAFDDIIANNKSNAELVDRAYAFKADSYDYMSKLVASRDQQRADKLRDDRFNVLLERASAPGASDRTKASVYYNMGKFYWDKAYLITEPHSKPPGTELKEKIPADKIEELKGYVEKARDFFKRAAAAMPEWADTHSMLRLTHLQEIYVADSTGADPATKEALVQQYEAEGELAKKYNESEQTALMRAK